MCRKLFFTSAILAVVLASTVLAGYRPVARWDVVPDQRLDSVFKVGVVAFHASGVKVEFRVGGTLVHTANNPTLNSRTDVWEFWFALDPASYSDGSLTIDARAIPLEADPNSYDLPSLQLYANSGGSLNVSTVKWADSVNGSDSNPGTESQPYQTLAKAVQNTPSGGLINLKAGTYSPQSLGGGSSRPYWTTIQSAPGVSRDDVELSKGRPSTQRLKLKDLTVFSNSTSGDYDTILDGEQGSHSIWLDNVKAYNKNGRWAASTQTFGNIYVAYITGGITTQVCNGPGGSIVRNHTLDIITSDAWTGGGKLVVNCTGTDIDPGSTGAHPDFHQAYSPAPNWCENSILYNVSGYSCLSQGLFGHRLKNSAFVNVLFERHPDTVMYSQYSEEMVNDLFFHINIINQSWLWRGTGDNALDAYNLKVFNSIFGSMSLYEDASEDGMEIDYNHFSGSSMGTNKTLGDPQYVNPSTSDYQLQSSSPAYGTGKYLQCVPADIDGVAFDSSNRNRGCYAAGDGNVSPVADAGTDQNVTDTDENGSEVVTLDGSGSYDSDGTIESYVWKEGATQIATGESPDVTLNVGQHTITLTVTDNDSATDTDDVIVTVSSPADTTPPSPDPMTWATEPYATGSTSISMTATTATDASGVEYYFDETSGNPGGSDSGWQDSSTYQDTGLNASTQYTYRVKARDKSSNLNETAYSTSKSATTSSGGGEPNDIDGHTADTSVNSGGGVDWNGSSSVRVGGAETTGIDKCVVYVFELPTLQTGESITAANLSFYLEGYSYYAPAGNADLYGIAYRSSSAVQSSDWYQGTYGGDSGATALQDNIMLSSSPEDTTINSDSSGDNALKNYLNAQYDTGATGGDYVFLRVNADVDETYNHYWVVSMANNSTASQRPVLTVTIESAGDTTAPSPDPMTWSTEPYATGTTSISMTATTATDTSGVEYYFECTAGGGHSSSWQDSTTYQDTGLSPSTQYTYRVKARDKSANLNETAYSTTKSATTDAPPDTTPPSPDPMTWATEPYSTGTTSISMTATTATDSSGVEYYFDETSGNPGGSDSGWQDSATYEDTGLNASTQYTYRVKARDKSSNQNETAYSTSKSATTDAPPDTTPPSPDPMTWATVPYATGTSSISMTATTATDVSGVEYYFDCTAGGGNDSGWQDSATYTDTGLSELTEYTYRVKARDKSSNQNETAYSAAESATTEDGTAPNPDPMTWATNPYATGTTSISMTATTATDASGVEYYFDCTAGGGNDSGWQDSATYEDTGLSPETQYTYQVKARDKSSNQNETAYSTAESATTDAEAEPDLVSWWKLDESSGTTAADSSGNNHDGTLSGGSWAPTSGKFDGAVDLGAATSDHVEVPTTGMSASAGTVSVWGRIEGTQSGVRYFFGHTSSPPSWVSRIQLYMDNSDNQLDLGLGDSHSRDTNIQTLSANTWYHIALTWDGGDYVVYVDGISKASGTYTGLSTLGSIADIGNTGNSSWQDEGFQGLLDEVLIYDVALSKYDVADLAGITVASNPSPSDEAADVALDADLSWSAGQYAASHDVYMGTDYNSVADANHSSAEFKGNQSSTTYDPGTMSANTTYYWAIDEVNDTNTWPGSVFSFTTVLPDTTAPSPDPMTWATEPYATGSSSISMTATTATDASGAEYYFEETSGNPGGSDSGWQDSTTYEDTGLSEATQYTYRVRARDKSANQNATGWSTAESATTDGDPNLVSWWKLDESSGTTAADSSGNSHDGTLSGGSWAPTSGKYDGAVDLGDANSDRVQVPTTGMSTSAGTVSLWGRLEGTQSFVRYFFGHTSGTTPASWPDRIQLYLSDGDNQLDLGLGDSHTRATNIMTLSADTWYHIALTWDGSNYVVYVDGVSKANGSYTGLSSLNSIADVGNDGNSGYRIEAFQGLLDQVRVYNKELSQSEVEALADE